ncbi:MAG: hypothetical protein JKY56_17735 [Kofleriaceae bacterium]|nr:hypothetical protein [Kofleriaceae bacterium]
MSVTLKIIPGKIITREEFLETHPPFSIALDGYVMGEPFLAIGDDGPYRNFNHHEAVDRSCTSATCEQVRRAIALGLYDLYKGERGPRATVFANDCDQDVCLATWILFNPKRSSEPWVRTLAYIEDLLDMSSGGFPMPDERDLLGEIRWVFEPYTGNRHKLTDLDEAGMHDIIQEVHTRIERFLDGESKIVPLLGDYREIGGDDGWVIVEIDHQHARQKMVEANIKAAVELFARKGDRYVYSIWRRSEYIVDFPILEILRQLNIAEGLSPNAVPGWGGSENVGGSPRGIGSKLTPKEVEEVVRTVVNNNPMRRWNIK